MDAARLQQVADLYEAALEREPAERELFLRQASGGDEALRREVESLLAVHDDAQQFLTAPAVRWPSAKETSLAPSSPPAWTLATATRVGRYEIIEGIAAGGMGEVYRAADPDLGRHVAIKVLPSAFAHDAQRLARFEREAKTLAALNHPHIARIYGLERSNGIVAIVMELVDGETLAARIARGPIPLDQAMSIARQIADALEGAHDQGIVHRDLKPANINIRRDGTVKVLDFGLAKLLNADNGDGPPKADDLSATRGTVTVTRMLLGTSAYSSPEQVRGEPADTRSDVWAFGCIFYEMLTGRRAFHGESIGETIAAVEKGVVDWSALPAGLPPAVMAVLTQCLEKERGRRIVNIAASLAVLDDVLATDSVRASGPRSRTAPSRRTAAAALAALALISGAAVVVWAARQAATSRVDRQGLVPSGDYALADVGNSRDIAISRDGLRVAWATPDGALVLRSLVGPLKNMRLEMLGRDAVTAPFFSHDGAWIGYFSGDRLIRKVPAAGGLATLVAERGVNGLPQGATWAEDGTLVFATGDRSTGLQIVPPGSTAHRALTVPNHAAGESDHLWPSFLPGGRRVMFTISGSADSVDSHQAAVLDLDTLRYQVVLRGASQARYLDTGHVVYVGNGTLYGIPFDVDRLTTAGTTVPILSARLTAAGGAADFDVAENGTLVYTERIFNTWLARLASFDRTAWRDARPDGSPARGIVVVINWIDELKRLVPVGPDG